LLANAENARLLQSDEPPREIRAVTLEVSYESMTYIVFTHAFIFLGTAIVLLLVEPDGEDSLGRNMAMDIFHWLCILIGFLLVIRLCALQVRDARARPGAEGVSILSLVLQIIVLLVLALLQAFRPTVLNVPSRWRSIWWGFYVDRWSVSVNYFIMVVGHIVALSLRVFHSYC
jgi:hypothetical protein